MSPAYFSKICGTTGLIIFLIKDALEYAGIIIQEKKNIPARLHSNLIYILKLLNERESKLDSLKKFYFN